jgi:acyl-homoserine lactone acylase PvdQ
MNYLKYILIIIVVLILLTFLTIKLYFHYDAPEYSGAQELPELQDTVEIFTDSYGIPHIFAKNNEDLFFTAGYIIARERLFQLSLLAAVGRGEISRLLGDGYAKHDDYIKRNKLFLISRDSMSTINSENELLIQAYCSGINTWIDERAGTLPLSFKILNTKPLKWTFSDVINVVSIMTDNFYQNRQTEWFLNTIRQYFGDTKLLEMLATDTFSQMNTEKYFSIDSINKEDLDLENQIQELVGATGSLLQNSVMIIPKEKTVFQKPILIFEDIWGMQQPAKWYDIHLIGGDFNIEGTTIPGFPIPLVGKNNNIAWALTEHLTVESINTLFYIANGKFNLNQKNVFDVSISYVDTTGFNSNQKEHSQRFELLQQRLMALDKIYINDVVNILSDTKNLRKAESAHRIAKIYLDNNLSNKKSMNMLYEWDGDESASSSEALLINVIYTKLLKNLFMDEFSLVGEDVYDIFIRLPILAEQSINMILNNDDSSWIDDIKTVSYQEKLIEIVIKSIDEAINEIENDFGKNILNWQWGKAHTKTYKHVLYNNTVVARLFNLNIGPFASYGSNSNLNVSRYDFDNSYDQVSGISIRRIFDLSDMTTSYSILPTGQSGLPKSVHYADQVELFKKHSFRKIEFDETAIRNSDQYQKLVLCPAK